MQGIKIIHGNTLQCMGIIEQEHNRENIEQLMKTYVPARGALFKRIGLPTALRL